jgi:hypothetical protein
MPIRSTNVLLGIFLCTVGTASAAAVNQSIPAFTGAEGFGAFAAGGRFGEIRHVTNLKDSGPGSFRDAVAKPNAIVVFDLSGAIHLKSTVVASGDMTLDGQSAPGMGICICDYMVTFSGAHNDIVRYLRFRLGITKGQEHKYAVNMYQIQNCIFDHCSIEWGAWDCIGMTGGSDITVQYCIIGPGVAPQRFGCLCQSDNVTFSHNLWISNESRSPKAKGRVQYVNNIVYNWGVCGLVGGHSQTDHQLDIVNNYFIKGPDSGNHFTGEYWASDKVYQSGNMVDMNCDGKLNGRPALAAEFSPATLMPKLEAIPVQSVALDTADDAFDKVMAFAGASLHRDAVDLQLVGDVRSLGKRGQLIQNPAEGGVQTNIPVTSTPPSALGDGIPDSWKIAHHISLSDRAAATRLGTDGYTNLEHYLNELCSGK